MNIRTSLLGGAAISAVLAFAYSPAALAATGDDPPHHHHHAKAAAARKAAAESEELKGEVQELRSEVDALKAQQAQQSAAQSQTASQVQDLQGQLAQANARATQAEQQVQAQIETIPGQVQTEAAKYKPKTDKIYYKGITVTLGGFAAAESVYRSVNNASDIGSQYQKIPYDNAVAAHEDELHLTGRQSRISFLAQGDIDPGTVASFYGEFDFLGGAQTANYNESNSWNLRIRNLYGAIDWNDAGWHLLAGQSWSLVTMSSKGITPRNEVIPPTIDAQYVPGFVWARQAQVRITGDFADKQVWVAVSAESPQTTFGSAATGIGTTYSGVSVTDSAACSGECDSSNSLSLNRLPDVVGKIAIEPIIGGRQPIHAEIFGLVTQAYDRVNVAPTSSNQAGELDLPAGNFTDNTWGGGVGGGLTVNVIPSLLDLQASAITGRGIGRYGSGQLPDAIVGPDGDLKLIPETMFLGGATLHATPSLDFYVFGGSENENSVYLNTLVDGKAVKLGYGDPLATLGNCFVELGTCSADTRQIDQYTIGLWDKAYSGKFGYVRVGLQFSHTDLQAFPGLAGTNTAGILSTATVRPTTDDNMFLTSFRYYPF
jgi:hypothetical protein